MICSHSSLQAQSGTSSLGVGLIIGEPSGVSIKKWFNNRIAVDVGAAWSLAQNEALHLHSNLLLHDALDNTPKLSFYYGIGGRIIFSDTPKVGARIPLGLTYLFENIPFDLFVEAAPILDLTPDISLSGNGGFGFRYYF
ncbi:MAG: hypothetical protein CL666_09860 [Balneola sp.]|nr:hypothetical protein [Balneola sp.]